MHSTHLWYKLYLSGQKIALILLLMGWTDQAMAQQRNKSHTINLNDYEKQHKVRYGFQLGAFNSLMTLDSRLQDSSFTLIKANHSPGFLMGFILNFNMKDELWSFRILPNISFYERQVTFQNSLGENDLQLLDIAMIEVPMVFKYRSLRRHNHRMYMVGGLSFNIQAGGNSDDPRAMSLDRRNVEFTYGFGIDIYNTYFKLAPEIRFSHGLSNVLSDNINQYNENLKSVYTHRVAIIFNFE